MKALTILFSILMLTACVGSAPTHSEGLLRVTDNTNTIEYSRSDLEDMPAAEAIFLDVNYVGVMLTVLLQEAGYQPSEVTAVKAIAVDGYSANYGPDLITRPDTIISYARVGEELAPEEAPFRMVLPDQEGKLNVRQLVELQVIH